MATSAARWMAVGMTSLEDWPMLTWSLGWTGLLEPSSPPRIWMARLEITSLAFMLVEVPDPVWKMSRTNWLSSLPSTTSSAASTMASLSSSSSKPELVVHVRPPPALWPRAPGRSGAGTCAGRLWGSYPGRGGSGRRRGRRGGPSTSPIESRSTRCGVSCWVNCASSIEAGTLSSYNQACNGRIIREVMSWILYSTR